MIVDKFDRISLLNHEWPDLVPVPDHEVLYELRRDWIQCFVGWYEGVQYWFTLVVPTGFKSDGQSSPKAVWSCFRPDGPVRIAALAHDALYRSCGGTRDIGIELQFCVQPIGNQHKIHFSRLACDQVYREFYIQSAPKFRNRAWIGYYALRMAGRKYFGADSGPNGDL